ncbi:MAG: flippase-like domain-containing protein, partial [Synergistaceae bacterium]|nr:flippase-like domain-containing protein [Synergistaceae bacterium]
MYKKKIKVALQIAVSLLCVFYVVRGIDFAHLKTVFSGYALLPIVAAIAPTIVNMFIMSARIKALCGRQIGFACALKATVVGQGLNNVLPAKGGDVAKIVYISQEPGMTASAAAGAVIVERFFDANCLFVLSAIMLREYIPQSVLAGAGMVFFLCWAAFIFFRFRPAKFERIWDFFPGLKKIKFLDDLKKYLLYDMSPRQLTLCAAATAGSWLAYCSYTVIAFLCVGKFEISLAAAFVAFIISAAGQLIPSSPGSLGVLEASIVWGLGIFGVAKEPAVGIALFIRLI